MSDLDDSVLQNLRKSFTRDEEQVDSDTAQKLQIARRNALARNGVNSESYNRRMSFHMRLVPVAVFASALLVVVGLWQFAPRQDVPDGLINIEISVELNESDFELVEDLEFYEWLDVHGYAG